MALPGSINPTPGHEGYSAYITHCTVRLLSERQVQDEVQAGPGPDSHEDFVTLSRDAGRALFLGQEDALKAFAVAAKMSPGFQCPFQ